MSETEDQGQEKTEEPTERRLRKAREEGQVLTSKELSAFITLAVGFLTLWWMALNANLILANWAQLFSFDKIVQENVPLIDVLKDSLGPPFLLILLMATPIIIAIFVAQFALGGLIFSPKAFYFKGNRIDPIKGFKRVFGIQSLVELYRTDCNF